MRRRSHTLKQRLSQARLNKARRGELFTKVPTGYVRLPDDRIALDPDEHQGGQTE
jgi:hypothetical protein